MHSCVAVVRAQVLHAKRGGAPYVSSRSDVAKVGRRAARVLHEKFGGAPLPPLKKSVKDLPWTGIMNRGVDAYKW